MKVVSSEETLPNEVFSSFVPEEYNGICKRSDDVSGPLRSKVC